MSPPEYYNCKYRLDRGCLCPNWVRKGQEYCDLHEAKIAEIEGLEQEVAATIKKAREK
jgi:hypothetical protein